MVQAWYMEESPKNRNSENHLEPPQFVPLEKLFYLSRVELFKVDVDNLEAEESFNKLRKDRGYNYHDFVEVSRDTLPNYDEKLKIFFTEHLHDDEEIRLFLKGEGYFDVRDRFDKWIRIKAQKGDLIVLPAGIYHRFTTVEENPTKVMRLYSGDPVWTAMNRCEGKEVESRSSRTQHLSALADVQ